MINTLTGQFDYVFSDPEEREFLGELVEVALEDAEASKVDFEAECGKVFTVEEYSNYMSRLERKIAFLELLYSCLERG